MSQIMNLNQYALIAFVWNPTEDSIEAAHRKTIREAVMHRASRAIAATSIGAAEIAGREEDAERWDGLS